MPRNPLNPRQRTSEKIHEACEVIERFGTATSAIVRKHMKGGISASNASKYCSRAEKQHLVTADRSAHAVVYQIVPGWRDLVAKRLEDEEEPDLPELPRFTGDEVLQMNRCNRVPSSVWALGAAA